MAIVLGADPQPIVRPRVLLIPSIYSVEAGLVKVIEQAGFDLAIASDLQSIRDRPDILLVNIAGFGSNEVWADCLKKIIKQKMLGCMASTPTIVIDPPINQKWNVSGGWADAVDAYTQLSGNHEHFVEILRKLLKS